MTPAEMRKALERCWVDFQQVRIELRRLGHRDPTLVAQFQAATNALLQIDAFLGTLE